MAATAPCPAPSFPAVDPAVSFCGVKSIMVVASCGPRARAGAVAGAAASGPQRRQRPPKTQTPPAADKAGGPSGSANKSAPKTARTSDQAQEGLGFRRSVGFSAQRFWHKIKSEQLSDFVGTLCVFKNLIPVQKIIIINWAL